MSIIIIYYGYNNGRNHPVYNAHKNVGVHLYMGACHYMAKYGKGIRNKLKE